MQKTYRVSHASGRNSCVDNSWSGGGACTASSPTVDFVLGGSDGPTVLSAGVDTPGPSDNPVPEVDGEGWTVVSGRRRRTHRGKVQRPAYTPCRCDPCHLKYVFPSRTAYRNHLKWAHRLYLARTGRYIQMGHPDVPLRVRTVPPAAGPRPIPVPSGPAPPRAALPATARVRPTPLMQMQFPASHASVPRALMGIEAFPLVAEWRSQAASGRDSAMPPPAETARQPLRPRPGLPTWIRLARWTAAAVLSCSLRVSTP